MVNKISDQSWRCNATLTCQIWRSLDIKRRLFWNAIFYQKFSYSYWAKFYQLWCFLGTSPPTDVCQLSKTSSKPPELSKTQHPSLLTCHSYPGSSPPKESSIAPKPYKTVPPSPNQVLSTTQPAFLPKNDEKILERPNNLPNLSNLTPLISKPPQSPTQTSPRLQRHLSEKEKEGKSWGFGVFFLETKFLDKKNKISNIWWVFKIQFCGFREFCGSC